MSKKPKTTYTPEQEAAINEEGQNILVSASAGSGKTMVLVERLMRLISEGKDVTEFLVVTFTRAAAKEMKERVQKKIQERINELPADSPEKQHLVSQVPLVGQANISTIHSFCTQVIKKYYYLIDTDPVFRMITDDTEKAFLKEEVLDRCIEVKLEEEDPNFLKLLDMFSGASNLDKVKKMVLNLYSFAMSKPDYMDWIDKLNDPYKVENLIDMDIYQSHIKEELIQSFNRIISNLNQIKEMAQSESVFDKYIDRYDKLMPFYMEMKEAAEKNNLQDLFMILNNYSHPRKPSKPKGDDVDIYLLNADTVMGNLHKENKEIIEKIIENYFSYHPDDQVKKLNQLEPIIQSLQDLLIFFHKELTKKKESINALDFNDLEHKTLEILRHDSGEPQRYYQNQFAEIMIDEYQDTNSLQEEILQLISKEEVGNRFMVGDNKQSIYRFRLANPNLFNNKFKQYGHGNGGKRVILQKNFRSRRDVLDFTNFIFRQIMDENVGEIEYNDEAVLNVGNKSFPEDHTKQTEIMIYESDVKDDSLEGLEDEDRIQRGYEGESLMIAQKIREMIDNNYQVYEKSSSSTRDIQYGDIVILSSTRTNYDELEQAFEQYRIPTIVDESANYFKRTEITTIMSLLKIIDNPMQDIPLAAVLRSPIVGLTEPDLSKIRISDKYNNYYQALLNYSQSKHSNIDQSLKEKVNHFLNQLEDWRNYSRFNSLVDLIWKLYNDTNYLEYVGGLANGDQRQNNLHALYQIAASYEKTSFKGLFQFIKFIERMQKRDNDLAEPTKVTENDNAVRLMTIHKSKGLEFPVVFLANANKEFNMKDAQGRQSIDDKEGFGTDYIDSPENLYYTTWINSGINQKLKKQSISEEMRLLYVALTRAEQKIFITGYQESKDKAFEEWLSVAHHSEIVLPEKDRLMHKQGFLGLIGRAIIRHPKMKDYRETSDSKALPYQDINFDLHFIDEKEILDKKPDILNHMQEVSVEPVEDSPAPVIDSSELLEDLKSIINLDYSHKEATMTSSFQAVSDIKRLLEEPHDERQEEVEASEQGLKARRYNRDDLNRPKFLQAKSQQEVSPADIGSAAHLILQKLDFNQDLTRASIQTLIDSFVESDLIDQPVADQVNIDQLISFVNGDFGQYLRDNQANLKREVPFSFLVEAQHFFSNIENKEDNLLIHGVIDGFVMNDQSIHLFDHKTDRVSHLADPVEELKKRYKAQLNIYKEALEAIYPNCTVDQVTIYSLDLNQAIAL